MNSQSSIATAIIVVDSQYQHNNSNRILRCTCSILCTPHIPIISYISHYSILLCRFSSVCNICNIFTIYFKDYTVEVMLHIMKYFLQINLHRNYKKFNEKLSISIHCDCKSHNAFDKKVRVCANDCRSVFLFLFRERVLSAHRIQRIDQLDSGKPAR